MNFVSGSLQYEYILQLFQVLSSMNTELSVHNQDVINYIKRNGVDKTCRYMLDKYKAKNTYKTLHKDLTRLHQKYQQLNKSKSRPTGKECFEKFMGDSYQFLQYYSDDDLGKSSCSSAQYTTDNIFAPSDNPYLKAEAYRSVAGKLAWELYEANEGKIALEVERNLAVEEKDQMNDLLDIN